MEDAVEEFPLTGFDPLGEPCVRRTGAGRMWLMFNFMPPSWAEEEDRLDLGSWADFDKKLEQVIGVPVFWDDREWFRIDRPLPGAVLAIQQFLLAVRRHLDPTRQASTYREA